MDWLDERLEKGGIARLGQRAASAVMKEAVSHPMRLALGSLAVGTAAQVGLIAAVRAKNGPTKNMTDAQRKAFRGAFAASMKSGGSKERAFAAGYAAAKRAGFKPKSASAGGAKKKKGSWLDRAADGLEPSTPREKAYEAAYQRSLKGSKRKGFKAHLIAEQAGFKAGNKKG